MCIDSISYFKIFIKIDIKKEEKKKKEKYTVYILLSYCKIINVGTGHCHYLITTLWWMWHYARAGEQLKRV